MKLNQLKPNSKYIFAILLTFLIKNINGKDLSKNKFEIKFGAGIKSDYRVSELVVPIADTNVVYPANTGPPIESGMKLKSIVLPKFILEFNYSILNESIKLLSSIGYEIRGILFDEYNSDPYNQFEAIKYKYSFITLRIGAGYKIRRFEVVACLNFSSQINSYVTYYPKGAYHFTRSYPTYHYLLTHAISPELNLRYSFLNDIRLLTALNLGYQPLLYGSKMHSFSIGLIFKIL